jgi:hypothetical protein
MLSGPATIRSVVRPRNRPCSTMPARAEPRREHGQIGDRAEDAVEDQVALVGVEGLPVRAGSRRGARAEPLEEARLRAPAEGDHLDRHGAVGAQPRRGLHLVHDDDLAAAGLGDDLLPQQRAAAAFDQVEVGIDLVGAVDCQVHSARQVLREQGDALLARGGGAGRRGGAADDVPQAALAQQGADPPDGEDRRAAGAQAHHHARLHEIDGPLGRLLLVALQPGGGGRFVGHGPDPFPWRPGPGPRQRSVAEGLLAAGLSQHSPPRR